MLLTMSMSPSCATERRQEVIGFIPGQEHPSPIIISANPWIIDTGKAMPHFGRFQTPLFRLPGLDPSVGKLKVCGSKQPVAVGTPIEILKMKHAFAFLQPDQ